MLRLTFIFVIASLTFGCALGPTTGTKVYIDRSTVFDELKHKKRDLPKLNQVVTITPGESLISSYLATTQKAIKLIDKVTHVGKYNGFNNKYIVNAGDLPLVASSNKGYYYGGSDKLRHIVSASSTDAYVRGGVFIPKSPTENHYVFIDHISSAIEPLNRKIRHEEIELITVSEKDFRQELVYTGTNGDSISIEYREFKGNMARPAFSQSLTYNISNDKLIGFRGALFEVIHATNSYIEYRVIKHLGS